MSRSPLREWAGVAAAFGLVAAVAGVWLALDRRPPEWDYANHLERAVLCARDLGTGDASAIMARSSFYPPIVPCAAGIVYRLIPSDAVAGQLVVLAFLGIGMAAVYLVARTFAGGTAGVLAAIAFGTAPFVVFLSLRFQLDLPLAAMVAVMLAVLLRTDGFRSRSWTLIAGVVFALGMLTKPPFASYVLVAVMAVLSTSRTRAAIANAALASVVAVGISLPWYGPRLFGLPAQIAARSVEHGVTEGKPPTLSWAGLSYYPSWFPYYVGIVVAVLSLIGLWVAFRRRQWFTLAALLPPLTLIMLVRNKDLRYFLPLVPMVAVLAAVGFATFGRRARSWIMAAVVAAGLFHVSVVTFGVPPYPNWPWLMGFWLLNSRPEQGDWHQRDILDLLAGDSGGRPAVVSVVPNHAHFSISNFRYYGVRDGLSLRFVRAWDQEPLGVDYMVVKSGDVGPEFAAAKPRRVAERLASDPLLARVFPVIAEYPLPDGSVASVRARRVPPVLDRSTAALAAAIEAGFRSRLSEVARDVESLTVRFDRDERIRRGEIDRVELGASAATLGEFTRRNANSLRVHDIRMVLEDVRVNPLSAAADRPIEPLAVGRVRLEAATILTADLKRFLAGEKGFRNATVELEGGGVTFTLPQPGPDVHARVRFVSVPDRPFGILVDGLRIGPVPIPPALANWVIGRYDPAPRIASRAPFAIAVGRIVITPEAVRIVPVDARS
jgi:hypothetical protein